MSDTETIEKLENLNISGEGAEAENDVPETEDAELDPTTMFSDLKKKKKKKKKVVEDDNEAEDDDADKKAEQLEEGDEVDADKG
ncbi:hypothetical protein L0F63_005154 [Massospora cicadina]|nr:hypothetical protein L0F63_005154 [Massospora cicadina]